MSEPVSLGDGDDRLTRCTVFLKKLVTDEGRDPASEPGSTWVWVGEGSVLVKSERAERRGLSLKLDVSSTSRSVELVPMLVTVPMLPFR